MFRRIALLVVPALIAVVCVVAEAPPASATAGTTYTLGLTGYVRTVVAGGRVFVLGGPSDGIAVRNADGTSAGANIEVGATDIVASADGTRLFVALNTANDIAVVNTSSLAATTYATGADTCPQTVAVLGTTVWFGYGCSDAVNNDKIGALDLSGASPVVTLASATGNFGVPVLRASDAAPGKLFAAGPSSSPTTIVSYTVSGTTLTSSGSVQPGSNFQDMAITADGADLVTADGAPYNEPSYRTSDLAAGVVYGTNNPYPVAVATSSNGFVAAGVNAAFDPTTEPDVSIYTQSGTLVRSYVLGGTPAQKLERAGLAFGANGSALYAVGQDGNNAITLHVISGPTLFISTMTLTGPSTSVRTKALTLTGTLTSNGVALASNTIHVTKKNMDGTGTLTSVTTDGAGHFTIHDTPSVGGAVTYTATSTADATHAVAGKSFTVTVSRTTPSVTISTDHTTYGYHATVHITGYLGKTYKNRTLTIYYTQYGHSKATLHANAKVDNKGHLTASFVGSLDTTVTVTFPGDEIYNTRSVSKKIDVAASESSAIAGYYKKSGSYYVFHESDGGAIAAKIAPNVVVSGRHVWFVMQVYKSGKWVSATANLEVFTDGSGVAGTGFDGGPGHQVRIRAEFHGDQANAPKTGGWWYIEFT